jgi:hypothetical protein
LIDQSDFVLSNLHSPDESGLASLCYAHNKGKHTVAWTPFPLSPWLASYAKASFEKLEHALDYILIQSQDMQKSIVDWSIQYEASLRDRSERFPNEGESDFQFFSSGEKSPFLVIAPHATSYWHLGSFREAESYTGAVAAALSRLTGIHSLVSSYSSPEDSLYSASADLDLQSINNPLLSFIKRIIATHKIKFVLILRSKEWESERGISLSKFDFPDEAPESRGFAKLLESKTFNRHIKFTENNCLQEHPLKSLVRVIKLPVLELQIHRSLLMPQLHRAQYHNLLCMLEETIKSYH